MPGMPGPSRRTGQYKNRLVKYPAPPRTPTEYAINWWKIRHDMSYFPSMTQHLDWKLYDAMEPWFLGTVNPTRDDRCLEIGCGYGQWMAPLSRLTHEVIGFDLHESLVAKSREKFAGAGITNARVLLGNGRDVPDGIGTFSVVYSISVFQHMPRETVYGYVRGAAPLLLTGGRGLFYFRADNGSGPYSKDIGIDHHGDWSVGWSGPEIEALADDVNWKNRTVTDIGDAYVLVVRV